MEETRKEQQNYLVRVTKIEKQLEQARSGGDTAKIELLESDMTAVSELPTWAGGSWSGHTLCFSVSGGFVRLIDALFHVGNDIV